MCKVISVNISEKKGIMKHEVPFIELKCRHGIVGDAHAGDWHRQISLLAEESIDKMRNTIPILNHGSFAENINTSGIELKTLPIGTRLKIGDNAIIEVTQIGKKCHSDCEIKKLAGVCVMPSEGIFAIVINEGIVKKGDIIKVLEDEI